MEQHVGNTAPLPLVAPVRPRRKRSLLLGALLWLCLLACVALMAIRCVPADLANGRAIPEVVSFVPLLLAPLAIVLAIASATRRWACAIVSALALATTLWWHAGFFVGTQRVSDQAVAQAAQTASADDSVARLMTVNACYGSAAAEQVVDLVREKNVEVLCIQEITPDFLARLEAAGLLDLLPYQVVSDEATYISNGGRNGIWTLAPMENVSDNLLPIDTSSMPAASIQVGSRTVRVVSVHPNSPVRGAQDVWDAGLSVIGSLSGYNHSYLIMGDFNSTWNHARFRELLGTTFTDASQASGQGFHMTYPSDGAIPPLVEIDHIVYSAGSGVTVSELECVSVEGTDHMALLGVLEAL